MADLYQAAERALATHGGFERRDAGFVATSTPFEATVELTEAEEGVRYDVTMELPALDAVVADETVAAVVQEGWFETFDRRLEDLDGALRADADEPTARFDDRAGSVTVTAGFAATRPDHGAEDAAALVGYVEGTYVEGIIPGYTYREPVAGLLERAREAGARPDR